MSFNQPLEVSLEVLPKSRFDMTDITRLAKDHVNGKAGMYRKAMYSSFHTTAGYLDQSLCSRLKHNQDRIASYIRTFKHIFPINGDYLHDKMELRSELSESQKKVEPKNADSHLTFIGSGLRNNVTYDNNSDVPVYFIDLDGVHEHGTRNRKTNILYFNEEKTVFQDLVDVPVSHHPVDSINLRDPRLGYLDKLNQLLEQFEVEKGRVEISLDPSETHSGLTVNEYETLLMTHDLIDVLKNPLEFMGEKGKYILNNPHTIPRRTREYAKYDFVQVFNELMDAFHVSESVVEKLLSKFFSLPAEKFLRLKRSVSLPFSNVEEGKAAKIVEGTYQSPILLQWQSPETKTRKLHLKIVRYN
jgi:thiamine phosphate synthase YjbQ (UPF0047 family)